LITNTARPFGAGVLIENTAAASGRSAMITMGPIRNSHRTQSVQPTQRTRDVGRIRCSLLLLSTCAALILAVGAQAAAGDSDSDQLQEVIVTAEKRASTVQDTAISMSALSGTQLEAQGIVTVEDLAAAVPGISMRSAGPGQTEYEMRGLASSGGAVSTVGFYVDEVALSASADAQNGRTVIDPDLFDMNRVEVLRGPQGTLYGAGSMGGTIKLVTNAPKLDTFESAVEATGSKTDGGGVNGGGNLMLNLPIGEYAALRLVATDKYISGWIDRVVIKPGDFPFPTNFGNCSYFFCTRGDVLAAPVQQDITDANIERFASGRAALLIKPTDSLSITATAMYQRIDADGPNQYQSPPGPLAGNYSSSNVYAIFQPYDIQEPYVDSFKLLSLTVAYELPFAQLTSATGYWSRNVIQTQDATEAMENTFNLTQFLPTLYPETDSTTQISQELRLTSTGDGPFQWVGGLYAVDLHSTEYGHQITPSYANAMGCASGISGANCPPGDSFNINNGGPAANPLGVIFIEHEPNILKQSAVFGEFSYKLASDLKLTAGLRYFKFSASATAEQCGVGSGTGNGSCTIGTAGGSGDGILPKVNLAYTPTPDLMVYGTVSKGSRPGGLNTAVPLPTPAQLAANPQAVNCGPGSGPAYVTSQPLYYNPDEVWSYELGEKARFDDQRFTFNADVYYIKWENILQYIPLTCGYQIGANVGTAHAYGPEAELSARLTREFTLTLSGAVTQADIYAPTAASAIVPGTRILDVPKSTATVSLEYVHKLTSGLGVIGRIADSYVGPMDDVAYYRVVLPSHNLIDGRVGVKKDTLAMYLVGTNLTNKHAELTINDTGFAWQQPTLTRVTTNQPRTIGFDVQYSFQ
jgi:iron complex outermembrane receptor protein